MGDEIDPSVLQTTQQKLGKFIQKPQLTDKLLKRPPFRFVHDIVTASIKQYGVFDNVFTKQELISDNIKEKEEKIAFLQKLINHVSNELGQELNVKPSKIVAGSEADKTNELLQAMATVLENKHSNTKKNPSNKKPKESGASNKGIAEHNTPTKVPKPSNGTINNMKPKATPPAAATTKKTESSKESTVVKKPTTKPAAKPAAKNVTSKPTVKAVAKAEALAPLESDSTPKRKKSDAGISILNQHELTSEMVNEKDSITPTKKLPSASLSSRKKSARDKSPVPFPGPELFSTLENERIKEFGMSSSTKQSPQMSPDLASTDSGITVEHPPSAPLNGIRSMKPSSARASAFDEGFDAADGTMAEEDDERHNNGSTEVGKLSPPISAVKNTFEKPIAVRNNVDTNRPPSGNKGVQRPRSSRRPPSRTLRDRLSVIRQDTRPMSGQVPRVIIEGNTYSDDEEDRIVQAAVFDQTIDDLTQSGADQLLGGEQGKLVEEILSAQRQLDPVAEESGARDTSASSAQVQHLRALIQEMAQSALPLGQLIPLIHEDIESMQQEWQLWKKEADTLEEQYNREKTALDGYLVKLEAELQELDKSIQEEQMKLNAEKASVLRSEKDVSLVISNFSKKR